MSSLRGRVVAVTGAGSGIGRAIATEAARRGARLAVSDLDGAAADATADACRDLGAEARAYVLDVTDAVACIAHAAAVAADFGAVHVVVNNAGIGLAASALDQTIDDVDAVLAVNLHGVVNGTQAFLPHLVASGDGHVVNISSAAGLVGFPGQSAYSAAKFGVRGYTEALAIDLRAARVPVGVTCVHPGGVRTPIARNARYVGYDADRVARLFEAGAATSPARAARRILDAVERDRARVVIGPDAWAVHVLGTLLGAGYIALMARLLRRSLVRMRVTGS